MAGIITHFMVCNETLFSGRIPGKLKQLLSAHADWMFFGAACPDLPYAMPLPSQAAWADVLHYEKTDSVVELGRKAIKSGWSANDRNDRAKLAWLLGYLSHIIADVIIHPVVEQIVGPYSVKINQLPHRECEKFQDSLLFFDLNDGLDITYAEYIDRFDNCANSMFYNEIMDFWKQMLIEIYPDKVRPNPRQWFSVFRKLFDLTDNNDRLVAAFRHMGSVGLVDQPDATVYDSAKNLRRNRKAKCKKFYDNVNIPGNRTGSFRYDVFEYTVEKLADSWNDLYDDLEGHTEHEYIAQNWNLDTGMTLDGSDELTYWS